MLNGNFSKHGMTAAEVRELSELRHKQELELIKAKSDAKILEIQTEAEAQMQVNSHQAELLTDLFERQASLEINSESHRTHEFGKKLQLSREHESFVTQEQAKRARLEMSQETHRTHEFGKKLQLLQKNESFVTQEQAKRAHQEIEAAKRLSKEKKALESSITCEHRKRTNYQIEADRAHYQAQFQLLEDEEAAMRGKMVNALKYQYLSHLLQNSSDSSGSDVIIEELPDTDSQSALVRRG